MKVIAMIRTTVPVEIEVDDKFKALAEMTPDEMTPDELWEADELSSELLEQAEEKLPENGYWAELISVETTDGLSLAEW